MYYEVHNREQTIMQAIQIETFGNPAEVVRATLNQAMKLLA